MKGRPAALKMLFNSSAVSSAKERDSIAHGPLIKKSFLNSNVTAHKTNYLYY
jgi:hypothetical protein